MEHDQNGFYEAEDQEQGFQPDPSQDEMQEGEVNDMVYFTKLMDTLRRMIEEGTRVPLTGLVMVKAEDCLKVIDDINNNLPDAIQYGMQLYSEKKRIMGNAEDEAISRVTTAELKAKKAIEKARKDAKQILVDAEEEANAILQDANERAEQMVSEAEIVRQARDEARSIKSDARVEAGEMRLKASHDVYQMLSDIEGNLNDHLKEIRRLRSESAVDEKE